MLPYRPTVSLICFPTAMHAHNLSVYNPITLKMCCYNGDACTHTTHRRSPQILRGIFWIMTIMTEERWHGDMFYLLYWLPNPLQFGSFSLLPLFYSQVDVVETRFIHTGSDFAFGGPRNGADCLELQLLTVWAVFFPLFYFPSRVRISSFIIYVRLCSFVRYCVCLVDDSLLFLAVFGSLQYLVDSVLRLLCFHDDDSSSSTSREGASQPSIFPDREGYHCRITFSERCGRESYKNIMLGFIEDPYRCWGETINCAEKRSHPSANSTLFTLR